MWVLIREKHYTRYPYGQVARKALTVSVILHVACALFLIWAGFEATSIYPSLAIIHWIGTGLFIALLVYQHLIVGPDKLDRVNLAFFTTNGFCQSFICPLFYCRSDFLGRKRISEKGEKFLSGHISMADLVLNLR